MISLEQGGVGMRMSLEQLGPFLDRLDRDALQRIALSFAAHIRHLEGKLEQKGSQDRF